MRSVGILGGSYNPPHLGHRNIAAEARDKTGADEIWLWVSRNIFKDEAEYAPLEARMTACSLMAAGDKWLRPTGIESDFFDTLTATSLTMLKAMYPQTNFIWIFGEDNFAGFHNWNRRKFKVDGQIVPDWQYLMRNFPIAVMRRPGFDDAARSSPAAAYGRDLQIKQEELGKATHGWAIVDNTLLPHSSTRIKQALRAGEQGLESLGLPAPLENYIYDRGLFGVPGGIDAAKSFNIVGKLQANNAVRFDAFIALARAVNLCKAVMASTECGITSESLIRYAGTTWDRAESKGDLGKASEVPGEVADSLISLYWLASPLNIGVSDAGGRETQKSVTQWCEIHYPGQSVTRRLECMIEETVELCAAENMEKQRMMHIITEIFDAPDCDSIEEAAEKTYRTLSEYAESMDSTIGVVLDDKMVIDRARTTQASAAREKRKRIWTPQ